LALPVVYLSAARLSQSRMPAKPLNSLRMLLKKSLPSKTEKQ
jgi:hypothetical protein